MIEWLRKTGWVRAPQLLLGCVSVLLFGCALTNLAAVPQAASSVRPTFAAAPRVRGAFTTQPIPDCTAKPCIALTFDDGPNPATTPRVLDILKQENIHATFFMVGIHVVGNEGIVKRAYQEGNEVGNHSWDHPDLTKLTPAEVNAQIQQTQVAIATAGVPAPRVMRPPYGAVDDMVKSHIRLPIVRWDIDPEDWLERDPGKITQSVLQHAKPGGIILMHDIYPSTVDALKPVIDGLRPNYQFVTASQLLQLTPGDQGQYFAH